MSWEEAGAYEWMENSIEAKGAIDGCNSKVDIIERYKKLNNIFEEIKREGKFNQEFKPIVHIGPEGKLYFEHGGGMHRISIAYILKVPFEAQIGCVHVTAIPHLYKLRENYSTHEKLHK